MYRNENVCKVLNKVHYFDILNKFSIGKKRLQKLSKNDVCELESIYSVQFNNLFVERNETWLVDDDYDLDIIIPIFNTGLFLNDCIKSIINQKTSYKIRIFAVNDGSTDSNTLNILSNLNNDSIVVINRSNGGISLARNQALDISSARYVMFVDADDMLTAESIDKLLDCAFCNDADIVEGAFANVSESGKRMNIRKHTEGKMDFNAIYGYPWGKVIKRKLFFSLQFPIGFWFEDSITKSLLIGPNCSVYGISDVIYEYRKNKRGISFSARKNIRSLDSYWVTELIFNELLANCISIDDYLYDFFFDMIVITFRRNVHLKTEYQISLFNQWVYLYHKVFDSYLTNRKSTKDLEKAIIYQDFYMYYILCIKTIK